MAEHSCVGMYLLDSIECMRTHAVEDTCTTVLVSLMN